MQEKVCPSEKLAIDAKISKMEEKYFPHLKL
jgi:hypothetical protein